MGGSRKSGKNDPSNSKSWKILESVFSHLKVTMEVVLYYCVSSWLWFILKPFVESQASLKFYTISRIVLSFWFVLTYGLLEDGRINEVTDYFLFLYFIKHRDSTLLYASSIIDPGCHQNVFEHRWHTHLTVRVTLFCSSPYHILTSSVIYFTKQTHGNKVREKVRENAKAVNDDCIIQ